MTAGRSSIPLLVMLLLLGLAAGAQGQASLFTISAALDPPEQQAGATTTAVVTFSCAPEHYVYSDSLRVKLKDAGDTPTHFTAGLPALPPTKTKYDKLLEKRVSYLDGTFQVRLPLSIDEETPEGSYEIALEVEYQGCGPTQCYLPESKELALILKVRGGAEAGPPVAAPPEPPPQTHLPEAPPMELAGQIQARSLLGGILLAFIAGLGLTLTPCIYPMIPITISVIGASSGRSRLAGLLNSLVYVLGISLTLSVLGVAAASAGGLFGGWATHPAVYLLLAALFIAMAGAMLDLYVVQLPSSWAGRGQERLRGRGGMIGVFALGLLSGAVATPCISPVIVGLMAYIFQSGDRVRGFVMFFALAWGLGTPLVVLGTFTGLAKSLPKSGAWMQRVKRFFAFCLLAAALYFVGQSGLIPPFWYRAVVAAFLATTSVFVGAFDVLHPESGWFHRARKAAGLIFLAAGIAVFVAPYLSATRRATTENGIAWLTSEQQGIALARTQNKPVLIDFWSVRCPPCIKLDRVTFSDPRVIEEAARFVAVKVDGESLSAAQVRTFREKYGLWGVPHVVFISSEGRVLHDLTITEFVGPDEMLRAMRAVR